MKLDKNSSTIFSRHSPCFFILRFLVCGFPLVKGEAVCMKVKFTLNMSNLVVSENQSAGEEKHINRITFSWVSDLSQEEILSMSSEWLKDKNFLTSRMEGLKKVGESSLTIEPLEEIMA
jgi:hypothetical protein